MTPKILDAVIVGTGFAGLCSAIKLKQAGKSFQVIEKDSGVGGVWRANTYPGAQCDVQSHLYSFSFEPKPDWSRTYGLQHEILEYLEHCAEKYGIYPHTLFNCAVTRAEWKENLNVWEVETNQGDVFHAKTFFLASGGLSQISMPDIKGLEKFKGNLFHSARWDHSVSLSGKKVGVIGSAASAIQIVPAIAPLVKHLTVFQRTPSWIIPKDDHPYSEVEKTLFKFFPFLQNLSREIIYWQLEWRAMAFVYAPFIMNLFQEHVKRHIRSSIQDPELVKKVTPNYTIGCKRILLSNDFYSAIQRPNVTIETTGIAEIDEKGILLKDGSRVDLDVIVTATGFKVAEGLVPFEIKGRNGLTLSEAWKNGPEAYLGTTIKGFPNMFMIVGPNTGLGHSSMVYMIEAQVHYAMKAIEYMDRHRVFSIEVKPNVQDSYNLQLQEKLSKTVWNTGGCSSWYKLPSGKNTTLWPGFTFEFKNLLSKFNSQDYIGDRRLKYTEVTEEELAKA
jgi:cation diffusion facilitator CzcD-associated flavoprotein CzcO